MVLLKKEGAMKRDLEVLRMMRERAKGRTQEQAAARAGMSVRTARTYERLGQLPSQLKQPRRYRTRPDPFEADWPWVVSQLERDDALQATTLFALLGTLHPGRYQAGQVRTLQQHIAAWRAQHGPTQEVMFPQIHRPGVDAQSDFTHMESLSVTLGGVPFPHLVFHLVLQLMGALEQHAHTHTLYLTDRKRVASLEEPPRCCRCGRVFPPRPLATRRRLPWR